MVYNEKNEQLNIGDCAWIVHTNTREVLKMRIQGIVTDPLSVFLETIDGGPYRTLMLVVEDFGDDISKGPHLFSTEKALYEKTPKEFL